MTSPQPSFRVVEDSPPVVQTSWYVKTVKHALNRDFTWLDRFRHVPAIDPLVRWFAGDHDEHISEDEMPGSASGVVWLGDDIELGVL